MSESLPHTLYRSITLACIAIVMLVLADDAHAACDYPNGANSWGWDNIAKRSCPPIANNSNNNVSNPIGARISWPSVSGANRYQVQWQNNGGGWLTLPVVWNTTVDFYFFANGVQLGSEFCVRVQAADWREEWSGFSPIACVNLPGGGSVQATGSINSPQNPSLELFD